MVTLHLVQQAYAHPAETLADAYDLTLAGYAAERADGGDLTCDHCGAVIAADEACHYHTIGGVLRPVCSTCDAREPE